MLSRIYLNGHEDTCYPLLPRKSGYPDNLITGLRVVVPSSVSSVFVTSVDVSSQKVEILLSCTDAGVRRPLGRALWDRSGYAIATIYSEQSSDALGWVSLGSGVDSMGVYTGEAEVDPVCLSYEIPGNASAVLTINGVSQKMPVRLRITTDGAAYSSQNTLLGALPDNGSGYDTRTWELDGPITKINGEPLTSGTVYIHLPDLFDSKDTFIVKKTVSGDIPVLEISNNPDIFPEESSSEESSEASLVTSTFGCPETSYLTDIILPSSQVGSSEELPLDSFLHWYNTVVLQKEDNDSDSQ